MHWKSPWIASSKSFHVWKRKLEIERLVTLPTGKRLFEVVKDWRWESFKRKVKEGQIIDWIVEKTSYICCSPCWTILLSATQAKSGSWWFMAMLWKRISIRHANSLFQRFFFWHWITRQTYLSFTLLQIITLKWKMWAGCRFSQYYFFRRKKNNFLLILLLNKSNKIAEITRNQVH